MRHVYIADISVRHKLADFTDLSGLQQCVSTGVSADMKVTFSPPLGVDMQDLMARFEVAMDKAVDDAILQQQPWADGGEIA
jgi:hypothetical protein